MRVQRLYERRDLLLPTKGTHQQGRPCYALASALPLCSAAFNAVTLRGDLKRLGDAQLQRMTNRCEERAEAFRALARGERTDMIEEFRRRGAVKPGEKDTVAI